MNSRRLLQTAVHSLMIVLTLIWPVVQPLNLSAADFYWDTDGTDTSNSLDGTGLGGNGTWDAAISNWWPVPAGPLTPYSNTVNDRAFFSGSNSTMSSSLVTVANGINANRLSFIRSGYTLSGGDITLSGTAPAITVNMGETTTINTQLLGSDGLIKTGGGALRLGNALNSYTGTTTISNGALIINNQATLGADTSTIVVSGSGSRGFGGGSLVLEGGNGSGVTLSRNLSLQGLGPISDRSAALLSVRDNTVSGAIASGVGAQTTRITATGGRLTLSGGLDVGGTAATTVTQLGAAASGGSGSYLVTGPLTGVGILEKSGSGTLILSPSDSSGFSGTVRVGTSSAGLGTGSSIRIVSAGALGSRSVASTTSVLDLNGGALEVRMDAPSLLVTGNTSANVYLRASSTIFADHAVGGSALNGTAAFGTVSFEVGQTLTLNGRNGYGVNLGNAPVITGDGNSVFTNNLNGNLTFTASLWGNSNNAAARTLTINGNGNTIVAANVNAAAAGFNHVLTKAGTGVLAILGTGSSLDGNVNIQGGTLAVTDFRSVNNAVNNTTINIGSTTTAGTLAIIGNNLAIANLTSNRPIDLTGTTGGATILASQTGTSPGMVINSMTATGNGTKNLTLGGANAGNNTINAVIPNASATGITSVVKTDPGTWVLAGNNSYTGSTTVTGGTLELRANQAASNIVSNTGAVVFDANATTQSAGGVLQFRGLSGAATSETLGNLTAVRGGSTVRLLSGGGGASSSLVFTAVATPNAQSSLNFDTSLGANGTITLGGVGVTSATSLPGNGHFYFNGRDFARSSNAAGLLVAPVYGVDAGFVNALSALVEGNHNLVTGNILAQPASTIASLKMTSNTLDLAGLLTVNSGGASNTDAGILVFGNSTISGTGGLATIGNGTFVYRVEGATNSLTLATPMVAPNAGGFTKNGAGTLVLSEANAQTGTNTINEGTVRLSGSGTIGGGNATLAVRQGATLDIGGTNTGTAVGALFGNGTITNSSAVGTLQVGNGNVAGTYTGLIRDGAGVTNLTKVGTATQTLDGFNTYSGVTTIGSTGLIAVTNLGNYSSPSAIGTGNATTNAGALVFNGTNGGLNYTGTVSVSTDRLFTFDGNGNATLSGGQIANSSGNQSAIVFNNPGAIAFGLNATVPQTLTLGGASTGDSFFNPQLTDNGPLSTGLVKLGAGTWILGGGNNTYSGTTSINQGVLGAKDGTSLSPNSGLILGSGANAGILLSSGNFTRNIAATPAAGTVTWNTSDAAGGGGFSGNEAKLVVALGGLASPTALTWGAGGFVGTSNSTQALIFSSANALSEVEFRNPIDLGGLTRTVQVDDNGNTSTDFATMTGAISGSIGGNFTKTGAGILQLFGDSSYVGNTNITAGTLSVLSLGNSALPGNSSVGANAGANTPAQAVRIGNGTTGAAALQYYGTGETSDRLIQLNSTTGSVQIHADGSGPLILTNVANDLVAVAGSNKTLSLRGTNTAGNMITSVLTDGPTAPSTLTVTVDSSATWILSGANTYTGNTNGNAGALGIGNNAAFGTGLVTLSGGHLFAYGTDRVIANTVRLANNTTNAFTGDYDISLTSPLQSLNTTTNNVLTNNIAPGKSLTVAGITMNSLTQSQTLTINGSGDTIINGNFSTSTGQNAALAFSGTGILMLGGGAGGVTGTAMNNGTLTVNSGTFKLGANEVIPDSVRLNNMVISPAANVTARFDLNGFNETINGLTTTSVGTTIIDNSAAGTTSTLAIGGSNQNFTIGGGVGGNYTIQNSGAGSALNLTKIGAGNGTITVGVNLNYSGSTNVTGGRLSIASPVNGTTGLSVTGTNSSLNLNGGLTNPDAVKSVNVSGGATLGLLDGAGSVLGNLTSLTLGSSGGTNTILNLNAGDVNPGDALNTDRLGLVAGTPSLFTGNTITLNITDSGLNAGGSYTLISSTNGGLLIGPLSLSNYILSPVGGFSGSTLSSSTDGSIILTAGALITGNSYFKGAADTPWNVISNWADDKAGATTSASTPGQGTDVFFRADNLPTLTLNTTLEQNFRVNSLNFEASTIPTDTPTSILIASGTTVGNRLEVSPQLATRGISIDAGGTGNVTISAPLRIGNHQTWNVADANSTLTISGAIQGTGFDVSKTGAGKVILAAAADPTFNLTKTADVDVSGGNLELTNVSALGSTVNANLARISVNAGGAFYYNNATSGTIANNLTLNGGTLSAGGNNQTYSSATIPVNVNSTVNLRDSNAVALNATARNVTLSGNLTGTENIFVTGNTILTSGNPLNGSLTLSGNNSGWSGDLNINRGSVTASNANSLGSSPDISSQSGRISFTSNSTLSPVVSINSLTLDGGNGTFEITSDNAATVGDLTVQVTGPVNLSSATNPDNALRLFTADALSLIELNGGVVLGGNSSISVGGNARIGAKIQNIGISEISPGTVLTINDDRGVAGLNNEWNQTNRTLVIDAASTYTGGTNLDSGILQIGNTNALGNGQLTITGNSTLQSGLATLVLPNALQIGNGTAAGSAFTIAGNNSITFNSATTVNSSNARTITNSLGGGAALTIAAPVYLSHNGGNGSLTIAGNGNTTVNAVISDSNGLGGIGALSKTGNGTLSLTQTNTYSGTTSQVGTGTQGVIAASANNAIGTGNVTLAYNTGATSGQLQLIGGITLSNSNFTTSGAGSDGNGVLGNSGLIRSVSGTNTISGNVNLIGGGGSSTYRADTGAKLVFNGTIGSAANLTRDVNLVGGGDFDINGVIRDSNSTPVQSLDKINLSSGNAGNTTLNALNTYTGTTTVTSGVLRTALVNALPITSNVIVNAGNATTATLDLNGSDNAIGSLTFGGASGAASSVNIVNTGAGTLFLGGNVSVVATGNFTTAPQINGKLNLGVNPTVFNVADSTGSAVDLNVNAEVGGTAGMTKMGNGTMTLTGSTPNINSGVTTVTEGTLILGKSPNVNAIAGLGLALNKTTPDIVVNGGNLILAASEQINDGVFVRVTSGSLNFNNKNETIYNLEVSGGDVNYGTGDILIEDPVWSGGTNNIVGPTTFGFLEISGGNNTVSGTGTGGAGTLTIGTASVQGPLRFNGDNNAPTLVLNSDNATAGTLKFRPGSTIDLEFTGNGTSAGLISSAGSGTNAGQVDLNGSTRNFIIGDATGSAFDMTISAKIIDSAGSSGINKTGAGTLVVSGANTYAGPTAVNAGTLVIDGSTAAGAVTVASGATLAGDGVVGGITTISTGAILSPGDVVSKVGVLDFSSNLALGSGSTFTWELLSNTDAPGARGLAGTGFDGVDVAGGLSIDAAANSLLDFENTLLDWSDPFWLTDHQWTVFQGTTPYGGSLFAAINSTLKDGQGDLIGSVPNTGVFSWGTSANNVVLNYTAVPEPSSILLTVLGLLGVGMRRSRKTPKPSKVG